ncbi:MAG: hypothetical protein ACI9I0_002355, partial [Rhodoferax sp.]
QGVSQTFIMSRSQPTRVVVLTGEVAELQLWNQRPELFK